METTKLSSKGQVIIPKAPLRNAHCWEPGVELMVIDMGNGILLRPRTSFPATKLVIVAGMFKGRVRPKTEAEIKAALKQNPRIPE